MSFDGYEWAWSRPIASTAKILLLCLVKHADNYTCECFPTLETIAAETSLKRRTLYDALQVLQDAGLVSVAKRRSEAGRLRNHYCLIGVPLDPKADADGDGAAAENVRQPRETVRQPRKSVRQPHKKVRQLPIELSNELSNELTTNFQTRVARARDDVADGFEDFWSGYPRKVGRGEARRAWITACRKTAPDVILNALGRYQFAPDMKYRPHPTTWLNGERWRDDVAAVAPAADYRKPTNRSWMNDLEVEDDGSFATATSEPFIEGDPPVEVQP
jgi:hypothetical protein